MRGELFGSSDQARQKSPKEHRKITNVDPKDFDTTNLPNRFDDLISATASKVRFEQGVYERALSKTLTGEERAAKVFRAQLLQ